MICHFLARCRCVRPLPVLLLLCSVVFAGCISDAKRHFDEAQILFEKRDLRGAKLELKQAIKADPEMLAAHKLLAHIDEYLGDQAGAASEYEISMRLDPADPRLRNKARFYRHKLDTPTEPTGSGERHRSLVSKPWNSPA